MNNILTVTAEYGINVNKDELIKALQYDRNQYQRGYMDGRRDSALRIYQEFRSLFPAYNPHALVRMRDIVEMFESVVPRGDY